MRTCVDVSGRGLEGIFVCVSEEGVCLLMSTCGFVYLCVYVCVCFPDGDDCRPGNGHMAMWHEAQVSIRMIYHFCCCRQL
jgi:hypothetical protein